MSNDSIEISFAHCRPPKSSLSTLDASGVMLGLAPSKHLSQTKTPSLLTQLLDKKTIEQSIFSVMLINNQEGVLSIGGTGAEAVDLVMEQTRMELERLGEAERAAAGSQTSPTDGILKKRDLQSDREAEARDWHSGWKWSKVQGAEGWWQILMQGVWVDGSKVLKNQPVVIDVRLPPDLRSPYLNVTLLIV